MDRGLLETMLQEFFLNANPEVDAVYLYGSQARGTARPTSDVDLGLLYQEDSVPVSLEDLPLSMQDELAARLRKRVQIVVLNTAPVDLLHRVFRDGRLVLDRRPGARIAFEVSRRREFLDLKPYLDQYRQAPPRRSS